MQYNVTDLDNYKIYYDKVLGTGEYSVVYYGVYIGSGNSYLSNNKEVAVKIINTKNIASISLNNEIDAAEYIKENPHPNIVEYYDIIRSDEQVYIIMEYCDCGNLRSLLSDIDKPMKEKWAKYYFSQIANGLQYLNNINVIHRDLKPSNILLTNDRSIIKICDFGFAVKLSNLDNNTICGSPLYMAPETLNNSNYDKTTDLWAVGLILYEMLFLKHPYDSCNTIPELKSKINGDNIIIPQFNIYNNNTSNECTNLLKGLLQKDCKKRISWNTFLNNPWLYKYINIINKGICGYTSVLKSTSPDCIIPEKSDKLNINIVEDYCNNLMKSDEIFDLDI